MRKFFIQLPAALVMFISASGASAHNISGALGSTIQGGLTARLGMGFNWNKSWWESNSGRLTGYWDTGLTHWESGKKASDQTSLSFAPVFVYEFKTDSGITPFIEAGIGVSLFSATRVGDKQLGSAFNFEDRLGFGLKFANQDKLGARIIHYSNAGIKEPNQGIESIAVFYSHEL
ncbi:acyloxyacyl hydrolase [Pseudomonas sp. NPDC089422]|uniref:acyloxyacyl hydrolase n=1 Tax=Pseudomonas sp. NPDC089422 TaxID=3364466 RepID=UPI00380F56A3